MTIGQQIRNLRIEKGMKQCELAKAAYLTPSYISRIENDCARPTNDCIRNIAVALDVSAKEILEVEIDYRDNPTIPEQIMAEAAKLPKETQETMLHLLQTVRCKNV